MTFEENLWSTFLGALMAFILGVVAFYITESIRTNKAKKAVTKAFISELDFNVRLVNLQIKNLTEIVESIAKNERPLLKGISFKNFQRLHLDQYYTQGLAFETLEAGDILALSNILQYVTGDTPDSINSLLHDYNSGNAIDNLAQILTDEREYLQHVVVAYGEAYAKIKDA